MISKITGGKTVELFTATTLNKYEVTYFKCLDTGFIQTEEPYWLEEAYSSAITKLDIGLLHRNELLRDITTKILTHHFNPDGIFLDYAGGYGVFTRMMRDQGFDFYHIDPYCKNIFSENFEFSENHHSKIELATAFEVFEHLVNPLEEIGKILEYSDNILFTTELQPDGLHTVDDWWYFIPETGQHISLYNKNALQYLATKLGCNFYTDGSKTHLFTKKKLKNDPFIEQKLPYFIASMKRKVERYLKKINPARESLLQQDWLTIKNKLK